MKVKTEDLIGPALNWAVATSEGYVCQFDDEVSGPWLVPQEEFLHDEKPLSKFSPSAIWSEGGPIIERERMSVELKPHGYWMASFQNNYADEKEFLTLGPTPLIAAMRCFVSSRLGDEVEVPEELMKISS